jgi:glucoamylase
MQSTWIEAAAKGRNGGPVRAGTWASVVLGTHPIEDGQEVWLEVSADDVPLGSLPAYWTENRGVNSHWHAPIPPQSVGARLHYRSAARRSGSEPVFSPFQDTIVRPNLPDRTESPEIVAIGPEGLIGNRMMTVRIDGRGSTQDVYFPTAGLHSDVRPAEGDLPQSRSNFRAIVGGLAIRRRLDWFTERLAWQVFQHYQGATNLLVTELNWRRGPIRVLITDLVAMGPSLPKTAGGTESPGQYLKRFRIINDGPDDIDALFGLLVQSEVNGGIGEPGLTWHDGVRGLLATNRGHGHANRKLARDSTVEFAIALDERGPVECEPTGDKEALLHRPLRLLAGQSTTIDLLVSGAFTGWRGDPGTFQHWLSPALEWFRSVDLDQVEQTTAQEWDAFIEPIPNIHFPKPSYAVSLRRSSLAAALHADARWGAIASGFDRGLNAYCWPRSALWAGGAFERIGHASISRKVFQWLAGTRGQKGPYSYWFQKYTIDGYPEWETPAVDQTATIPLRLEEYYQRTGDIDFVAMNWPMIERAASVCGGASGHPGLRFLDDLSLVSSAGVWDQRFGAFLYSNACVVAGLRSAARLAKALNRDEQAAPWMALADRIWNEGILREPREDRRGPGLIDPDTGRFFDARRLSILRGLWTDRPELLVEHSAALDISLLGPVVPFGLLEAGDPRMRRSAEGIFRHNLFSGESNLLTLWSADPARPTVDAAPSENHTLDLSSLASLWMTRYLIQLGRETGEGRHWNLAVSMLDGILGRLGSLGLVLRPMPRPNDLTRFSLGTASGVWELHTMLIETMLDLVGLDYSAPDRRLRLRPALASSWPSIGVADRLPCGEVAYRLDRPVGGTVHRLGFHANLDHPIRLDVDLTCPGLLDLGPWNAIPEAPPPSHDRNTGRLRWSVNLPAGDLEREWTWG